MIKEVALIEAWAKSEFREVWDSDDRYLAFDLCNEIRRGLGLPDFSKYELDKAYQFRTIFHPDYNVALDEFVNFTFGCW